MWRLDKVAVTCQAVKPPAANSCQTERSEMQLTETNSQAPACASI